MRGSSMFRFWVETTGSPRNRIDVCVKGTADMVGQKYNAFDIDILLSEASANKDVSLYGI